jgi:hypothetical protein
MAILHSKVSRIALVLLSAVIFCSMVGLVYSQSRSGPNRQNRSGTAFTYQGYLTDLGAPAQDEYDFNFGLFDDPETGVQVGGTSLWMTCWLRMACLASSLILERFLPAGIAGLKLASGRESSRVHTPRSHQGSTSQPRPMPFSPAAPPGQGSSACLMDSATI